MPRRPRLELPGYPLHVTQRGVNRRAIFVDGVDLRHFYELLCYVQASNKRHRRSGTLWQGRFKSCLVDTERYLLTVYLLTAYLYIELNPVRAAMVERPEHHHACTPTSSCARTHGRHRTPASLR
jgi:putative transposase